jgi:molybdopterin-containing oxidoreductase family iron-sulfur binding subunit
MDQDERARAVTGLLDMPSVNGHCGEAGAPACPGTGEAGAAAGAEYWRSLEELAGTPEFREFLHREFPAGATELLDSTDRRAFLKVMGASMALAGLGLAGCRRWPQEKIAPFTHRPEGRIPGVPEFYATSMELGGTSQGLLVTSFDGRPIKVEGNPRHPINGGPESRWGATDAWAQSSILDLYDPDRSRNPMFVENGARRRSTWADFVVWADRHFQASANARGEGLAVLCEATDSPSVLDMKARLMKRFPRARWHEYEPINNDQELGGSKAAFSGAFRPQWAFDRARVVVSLDADFLGAHPAAVRNMREFARSRRVAGSTEAPCRLYAFESAHSLTGANADHRFAVRSADVAAVAALLAAQLMPEAAAPEALQGRSGAATPQALGIAPGAIEQVVADLKRHRGASLVVAGPRQPAAVHALAHAINDHLENAGKTVTYTAWPDATAHAESIADLARAMEAGLDTLVIIGGNPAYNAPADLDFAARLGGVRTTIHLSAYDDETSRACTWHLPRAHYLEAWGDTRAWDGTFAVTQPLIEPLFGGTSPIELLAVLCGDELSGGYDIVRRTMSDSASQTGFERHWRTTLHEGFLAGSAASPERPALRRGALAEAVAAAWERWEPAPAGAMEVVFVADAKVHDGRFANNGWLQELPDPLSKLTWDNAVVIGVAAARRLGIEDGDVVRVGVAGRHVEAAALVVPGQHAGSATLALGYGRRGAGRIAEGAGFDFYPLRQAAAMGFAGGAVIERTGRTYALVRTQEHHAIDAVGRRGIEQRLPSIFREATFEEYRHNPSIANDPHHTGVHIVHRLSLWDETNLEGATYAWAMSIDLSSCTGCSACVIACQAENNIPIVGKDQVARGREMHWLRIDRYFRGDPEQPAAVAMQPVPCMMCENAPCEQVCPVAATTHDKDGINVMVYNRCVGTRYCSNNCPYKVRRFNFFDLQTRRPVRDGGLLAVEPEYFTRPQSDTDPLHRLQFNPEVTVRSRGVMEKCTYCVQRITNARIDAKNRWVKRTPQEKKADPRVAIPDETFTTACAQACPAGAIVFGDMMDPESRVSRLHGSPLSYQMLEELNNKPRTRYLARVRDPAAALAGTHEESHG